ncbi:probable RebB like protein [Rhodobacterales bacterium HTCC2150]|nr:probable RebB like protein [Rhodobacterales bacterium HTCC2150] [Rhodobacteraceae bacterium HTCC2150]
MPTSVNEQITDSVTQVNTKVLGDAPAIAMGSIYESLAHATGVLMENAVSQQNQQSITAQAATTQGVAQIFAIDTTSSAKVAENE